MAHPMDFDEWATPIPPTILQQQQQSQKTAKKSNTFDYHPENSIDDDDDVNADLVEDDVMEDDDDDDDDDDKQRDDEDGNEAGDELEPHDDMYDDIHLVAADSGNASATNSSTGGEPCCYDADASNDSTIANTNDMNLLSQQRSRHLRAVQQAAVAAAVRDMPAAARSMSTSSSTTGKAEGKRAMKSSFSTASSDTEIEDNHNVELNMSETDSISMPPPPPLAGSNVAAGGGMSNINHHHQQHPHYQHLALQPTASSTPVAGLAACSSTTPPAPFIPISEETVFLDPEPPMPSIATSSPHSGDSWMNYSSNSSDDFSGLSEQIKAVTSGRQTGQNSSDEASSDYDSSIISQTEVMLKRYKSQQDAFEASVQQAVTASNSNNTTPNIINTPPLTPKSIINKNLSPLNTMASPASSTTSSLKSLKGAVKRLRCKDDDDDDYYEDDYDAVDAARAVNMLGEGVARMTGNKEHAGSTAKSSSAKKSTHNNNKKLSSTAPKSSISPMTNSPNKTRIPAKRDAATAANNNAAAAVMEQQTQIPQQQPKTNEALAADDSQKTLPEKLKEIKQISKALHLGQHHQQQPHNNHHHKQGNTQQQQQQQRKFLQHCSKSLDIDSSSAAKKSTDDMHCLVDVRLIDFAHTAFVPRIKSALFPQPPTTIHHGPDSGFLTGLDSLNRLLNEILAEEVVC